MIKKQKLYAKVIKMPNLNVWIERRSGLIKKGRKCKHFRREYFAYGREQFIGVYILNISTALLDNAKSSYYPVFMIQTWLFL